MIEKVEVKEESWECKNFDFFIELSTKSLEMAHYESVHIQLSLL